MNKPISILLILCMTLSAPTLHASNTNNDAVSYDGSFNREKKKYPAIYYHLKKASLILGTVGTVCALPIWLYQFRQADINFANKPQSRIWFEKFKILVGTTHGLVNLAKATIIFSK